MAEKPRKENKKKAKEKAKAKSSSSQSDLKEVLKIMNPQEVQLVTRMMYRDAARYAFYIALTLCVLLTISICLNFWQAKQKEVVILGMGPDGALLEIVPLDDPKYDDTKIQEFAYRCLSRTYNYDFVHIDDEINRVKSECFTPDGGDAFYANLENNGHIENIVNNEYITTVVIEELPRVVGRGQLDGKYAWRLQAKVKIFYDSAKKLPDVDDRVMDVVIIRTPETMKAQGVAISQWNLKLPNAT